MFFRRKVSGRREYLQIVENTWDGGRARQRVVATVGRLDKLQASGGLEGLLQSGAKFCNSDNSQIVVEQSGEIYFTSHQVSRLVQVSPSTVVGWINRGRLSAFRTPGGHRRVSARHLREFLVANQMPIPPALQPDARTTRRIFVVDDDPRVIRAIKRAMEQHGGPYEIDGCEDGIQALVLIGALSPDLVLLDIYMEGIDGFEVCRRLRKMSHLDGVAIVAMTAQPSEEARARILDYGASDYWSKPITAEQIVHMLEQTELAKATVNGNG